MEAGKRSEYYEAIVQLRNPNQEIVNCIRNAVARRDDVFIAKEVPLKTGIDFFISSQKFAHQIGKILKKSFKGELVESRKLFAQDRQTSRVLYRRTVLFRVEEPKEEVESD
jgi:nonsense-mediated mRNA decay protein 3